MFIFVQQPKQPAVSASQPGKLHAVYTVKALDAAQAFDFESRAATKIRDSKVLKIGIVGFGTFGQFLALRMVSQGHSVCEHHHPEIWHPLVGVHAAHSVCRIDLDSSRQTECAACPPTNGFESASRLDSPSFAQFVLILLCFVDT